MINDRLNLCKRSLAFVWYSRMESNYIKNARWLNSKIHLVVNKYGMPINFIVANGACADCKEAIYLIKNINAKLVFADCAYDTNKILSYLNQRNIKPVIPPKRNRFHQRDYVRKLYCSRHIIENTFLALKRWRGISTHYSKTLDAFIAPSLFVVFLFYFNSIFFFISSHVDTV